VNAPTFSQNLLRVHVDTEVQPSDQRVCPPVRHRPRWLAGRFACGWAIIVILFLAIPLAAGELAGFLAGDKDVLWLAAYADNGGEGLTRISARTAGRWQDVAEGAGRPSAACAVGRQLHVFYLGGGYRLYNGDTRGSRQGNWPIHWQGRRVLAACRGPGGSDGAAFYIILSPPGPAGRASGPESATATAMPNEMASAAEVFACRGGLWEAVSALPSWRLPPNAEFLLAARDSRLYVMACTADGLPVGFARMDDLQQWESLTIPPWSSEYGSIRWLLATGGELLLAGTAKRAEETVPWLRMMANEPAGVDEPRWISLADQPLTLTGEAAVCLTQFADKLAIAYSTGSDTTWQVGMVEPTGAAYNVGAVSAEQDDNVAHNPLLQWLPVGLTVAMMLALMHRQRQSPALLVQLPANMAPAMWWKRIVAYVIDITPWSLVAMAATGVSPEQYNKALERLVAWEKPNMSPTVGLVAIGMYLAYSVVMEKSFGATIGKMVFRMRVVGPDGSAPSLGAIILRNLCKPVELITPMVFVFVVWPIFSRYRQRVGDIVACTFVVSQHGKVNSGESDRPSEQDGMGDGE